MSNVVMGLSAERNGYSAARPLDLVGLNGLVVTDAQYFLANTDEVVQAVLAAVASKAA